MTKTQAFAIAGCAFLLWFAVLTLVLIHGAIPALIVLAMFAGVVALGMLLD